MEPINFKEANVLMGAPKEMANCGALPGVRIELEGYPVIVSCWKPSKEDLESLNSDGMIYLSIWGRGMPPVNLSTNKPF